jgi:hypothetical protein
MPRNRPRSHEVDGGWLTGTARGAYVVPAGYCADHGDTPHATAEEAYQCYRRYLVERTLRLDVTRAQSGPCKVCGRETNGTVVINGQPRDNWCPSTCATVENVAAWWNAPRAGVA